MGKLLDFCFLSIFVLVYVYVVYSFTIFADILDTIYDELLASQNNQICTKEKFFKLFYSVSLVGQIISAFSWPQFAKWINEDIMILIAIGSQFIFYYLQSLSKSVLVILALQFLIGLCQNMTSIGKAYVFKIVSPQYTQVLFNFKSIFTLILSPLLSKLGVYMQKQKYSYSQICRLASFISLCILILYFVVIFLKKQETKKKPVINKQIEPAILINNSLDFQQKQQSKIKQVIDIIIKNKDLRQLMIVYCIMYNINEYSKKFNIYILTQPLDQGGANLDKNQIENWNLFAIIPILLFQLFFSKKFNQNQFRIFLKCFIALFFIYLLLQMHYVFKLQQNPEDSKSKNILYFLCIILGVLNTKILSPYFNQSFGEKVPKELISTLMGITFNIVVFIIIAQQFFLGETFKKVIKKKPIAEIYYSKNLQYIYLLETLTISFFSI